MNNYGNGYSYQQSMRQPVYGLKGRPVSSLDEARAIPIDFDGSVFYFPDLANKCIYTKQINADGTAVFNMYELKEMPVVAPQTLNTEAFVSRKEFEEFVKSIKNTFQQMATPEPQVQVRPQEEIKSF